MSISRNGKCNIRDDTNLQTDYSTVRNIDCPKDQTYYDFYSEDLKTVLNYNDNYFDFLDNKLPLFSKIVNVNVKWSLSLRYAFYRNTVGCLLSKYSNINEKKVFKDFTTDDGKIPTRFEDKRFQLRNILSVFVNFMDTYDFQNRIQVTILILNCVVILFNLIIIFYKFLILCCKSPQFIQTMANYEGALSFFLDFVIAVLGGVSYYIISKFIDLIDNLLSTDCVDNRVQYQFGVFNEALESTAEQNFQIFLYMIFKIVIIILSVMYYMIYKNCSFRFNSLKKLIMETINEGEDEMDLEALKEDVKEEIEPIEGNRNNKKADDSASKKVANKNILLGKILGKSEKKDENNSERAKIDINKPTESEMVNIIKENDKDLKKI